MTQPVGYQQIPNTSGVTIQIFNPTAGPCMHDHKNCMPSTNYMTAPVYPANYYIQDFNKTVDKTTDRVTVNNTVDKTTINNTEKITDKTTVNNTEKTIIKEVVKPETKTEIQIESPKKTTRLTDEYIMKLENYLDSKDVEKRIIASKDVLERVQEDESRKDNAALTALTNKMLKDPYQPIRFLALGILEDRLITGNDETIQTLKKVESGRYSKNGNTDQDAIKASSVLLKMTRKV